VPEPLLIVDGDNVAHARWRGRRTRADVPEMRRGLIEDVAGYAARAGLEVIVVLDGAGDDFAVGGTGVRHSGAQAGDAVIERLAHEAAGRPVLVVTADRALRAVVSRPGVDVIGPRELLRRTAASAAEAGGADEPARRRMADAVEPDVRARLERMRGGD
jgi:predicted RNA-binding protein with PIN domain